MQAKLRVNADHYASDEASMAYVFGRTGGNAQEHLHPRYADESLDPFTTGHQMIRHLAAIYEDPFETQNARQEYRSLMMKPTETFPEFNTRFLHLAGRAQIPAVDLLPDLFDKLTIDLQRMALPLYSSYTTASELATQCLSLDQGLRRIKARTDRIRNRNNALSPATTRDSPAPSRQPARGSTPATRPARSSSPAITRPSYDDPRIQALSNRAACFECEKPGHFARDCPDKKKDVPIQDVETDSGKDEP